MERRDRMRHARRRLLLTLLLLPQNATPLSIPSSFSRQPIIKHSITSNLHATSIPISPSSSSQSPLSSLYNPIYNISKTSKTTTSAPIDSDYGPPNIDAMRARAGVLRTSILKSQMNLRSLERQIECCEQTSRPKITSWPLPTFNTENPTVQMLNRVITTFISSSNVLVRKLGRVGVGGNGGERDKWKNTGQFIQNQTRTGVRIVGGLVENPERLLQLVDPATPTLVPHVPAILSRLSLLEPHVAPILEKVLNNQKHIVAIEPYLPQVLERFDDIEPHLPWILDNIDALAPYTGLLLKHIDELLLYADKDGDTGEHTLADQVLPYLEYYVSKLDVIGPHLPLLRPHLPKLLIDNRIGKVSPHIDKLFARGYGENLGASANIDVLLFWFGWCLRIPGIPKLFFSLPWSCRIVTFMANRLPKRFVRGYCTDVTCNLDGDYGGEWNQLD